jgi:hypothetical protein
MRQSYIVACILQNKLKNTFIIIIIKAKYLIPNYIPKGFVSIMSGLGFYGLAISSLASSGV